MKGRISPRLRAKLQAEKKEKLAGIPPARQGWLLVYSDGSESVTLSGKKLENLWPGTKVFPCTITPRRPKS